MASHDKRRNLRAWRNKRDAAKANAIRRYKEGKPVTCYLCKQPIDMTLPSNDRWAWTLDHIEAIAADGHILGQTMEAHRGCNSARGKGDKINPLQGQTRQWL